MLGKLNSQVPLVEEDAAVYSSFDVTKLDKGVDSSLAQSHRLELLAHNMEKGCVRRKRGDHLLETVEVFHLVISLRQTFEVLGELVILGGLCPLLPLG